MYIRDFVNSKFTGEVGIEIEMEVDNDLWRPKEGSPWRLDYDGSLRGNSGEYILNKPLDKEESFKAIDYLKEKLKEKDCNIIDSIRAAVHVHVNVLDMKVEQVLIFASCYYILEEVLVKWCGSNREGNHFCLRVKDAEYVVDVVCEAFKLKDLNKLNTDNIRYAALNWKALPYYGSLEFRSLNTEPSLDNIKVWIEILLRIKEFSLKYKEPEDLITDFSTLTPLGWVEECLGDLFVHIRPPLDKLEVFNQFQNQLMHGMRYAQEVIYFSKE